jgi:heterotetrameric sarcosine oxidase delta subunit
MGLSIIFDQRSRMAVETSAPLEISSVEDGVYRILREEIGRLDLAPGVRLRLEEVAGRLEVSLTPVRHALRRLESEGLVVSIPRRGSKVASLSVEELEEIQALRLGLETFLARAGAERITEGALAAMEAARDEMERAFRAGDLDAYLGSFWSLRDACYACAERPRLLRALEDQRIRVERYILYLCRDSEAFAALRPGHAPRSLPCAGRRGRRACDERRARLGARRAPADARPGGEASRMSFLLDCPNCGPRDVNEFSCAGEVTVRPKESPTLRELTSYVYFRRNVAGVQREWWYHRHGCEIWFQAERDTRTNEVLSTEIVEPSSRAGTPGPESVATPDTPAV